MNPYHKTEYGVIYCGDSLDVLRGMADEIDFFERSLHCIPAGTFEAYSTAYERMKTEIAAKRICAAIEQRTIAL